VSQPIGQQVRDLRVMSGLSQEQLALRSGVSEISISKIETGKVRPRLSTVRKLADGLGVALSVFDVGAENE
jgi:transcriptional regulator with XRE-family HTH domain